MRSRLVIPAALLVSIAYVKGRWDAAALTPRPAPRLMLQAPPTPEMLRAEAEAVDAMVIAQAQSAATTVEAPPERVDTALDLSAMSEWATTPGAGAPARIEEEEGNPALDEWIASVVAMTAPPPAAIADPEPRAPDEWDTQVASWSVPQEPLPAPVAPPAPVEVRIDESGRFSLGGWAAQAGDVALSGVTFRDRRGEAVEAGAIRLVLDADTNVADGGLVVLSDSGFAPDREGFTILVAAAAAGSFAAAGRYEVLAA